MISETVGEFLGLALAAPSADHRGSRQRRFPAAPLPAACELPHSPPHGPQPHHHSHTDTEPPAMRTPNNTKGSDGRPGDRLDETVTLTPPDSSAKIAGAGEFPSLWPKLVYDPAPSSSPPNSSPLGSPSRHQARAAAAAAAARAQAQATSVTVNAMTHAQMLHFGNDGDTADDILAAQLLLPLTGADGAGSDANLDSDSDSDSFADDPVVRLLTARLHECEQRLTST
jgi:hypothetical protein